MSDDTKSLTCCFILFSDHSRCHQDMSGTKGYDEGVFLVMSPHLYLVHCLLSGEIYDIALRDVWLNVLFFVCRCFWIPWVVSSWPMMAMPFWERWLWIPLHNFVKQNVGLYLLNVNKMFSLFLWHSDPGPAPCCQVHDWDQPHTGWGGWRWDHLCNYSGWGWFVFSLSVHRVCEIECVGVWLNVFLSNNFSSLVTYK